MSDTITYKLKHPVGDINQLRIRTNPTFKDYFGVKAGRDGEVDIKSMAVLIANLTNQPIEIIGKLQNEDWQSLISEVSDFF